MHVCCSSPCTCVNVVHPCLASGPDESAGQCLDAGACVPAPAGHSGAVRGAHLRVPGARPHLLHVLQPAPRPRLHLLRVQNESASGQLQRVALHLFVRLYNPRDLVGVSAHVFHDAHGLFPGHSYFLRVATERDGDVAVPLRAQTLRTQRGRRCTAAQHVQLKIYDDVVVPWHQHEFDGDQHGGPFWLRWWRSPQKQLKNTCPDA